MSRHLKSSTIPTEQTTSPSPIIKNYLKKKTKYACNIQKKYFHNFEVGQHVLKFGQHDGKKYYKIQKDI